MNTDESQTLAQPVTEQEPGAVDELCSKWHERIKRVWKLKEKDRKQWERNRKVLSGRENGDDSGRVTRANLVFMTMFRAISNIYAKDPEIAAQPRTGLDDTVPPAVARFGETMERVLNHQMVSGARLKRQMRRTLKSCLSVEAGWVKMTFQRDVYTDPDIQGRIEDTQQQLQRVQSLIADIKDDAMTAELLEAKQQELEQLIRVLRDNETVEIASGLVIDKISREHVLIDPAIEDIEDYLQSGWMAIRVPTAYEKAKELAPEGFPLERADRYKWDDLLTDDEKSNRGDVDADASAVVRWEIWDRNTMTVYTLVQGVRQWFREPFTPELLGSRFYPIFGLFPYTLETGDRPLSMVELLEELADEYNETRTQLREDRKDQKSYLIMSDEADPRSVNRVKDRDGHEVVLVDTGGGRIGDVVSPGVNPQMDPRFYDTTEIRLGIEMVGGVPDAANGNVAVAKTATEAEILQESLQTIAAAIRDQVEDVMSDMAQYAAELCLQEMTIQEVIDIVGDLAVWPKANQIYDAAALLNIDIRAGSTGKPNRLREQEMWSTLFPQLIQFQQQVRQMYAMGMDPAPEIEAFKELLARHDERLDVTRFIPPPPQQLAQMGFPQSTTAAPGAAPQNLIEGGM